MVSISFLAHFGPHGSFYEQAMRTMIPVGTTELWITRIRAMWTAIANPLIRSLFESTWLAQKASHVDWSRGAEI